MTLGDLSNRLSTLQGQLNAFARLSLQEREDEILDLQKRQLFAGKASSGDDIRPYYSEDLKANGGFFKSPQSAKKYAMYKAQLDYPVNVPRQFDAPNLYINGHLVHDNIGLEFTEEYMRVKGNTSEAQRVMDKYGEQTFGLSSESMDKLKPELTESITEKIKEYING